MFRFEYANGNNIPSAPTLASSSGGSLSAGTYYFWLQFFNRVGGSRFSSVAQITLTTNTRITVTIPSTARPSGVDAHHFVVHYSTSNDPSTAQQVARYEGYDSDQETPRALPADIVFTLNSQLTLSTVVANPAALPTTNLINGMLRGVSSLATIFRYDSESTKTVDNVTVLSASTGRWLLQGSYSSYITDTTSVGGMAQLVSDVVSTSVKLPPAYPADGSASTPIQFYINPGRSLGEDELEAGTPLGLVVFAGGVNRSAEFSNLLRITFNGYVNLADGTLNTGIAGSGGSFLFQEGRDENFIIPETLVSGFAYSFSIQLEFSAAQTDGFLAQGDSISILARRYLNAGEYFPGAALVGDAILDVADRRRIVPRVGLTATAKSGSVIVGNLSSPTVAESIVTGLVQNTASQKIAINGNGACYYRSGTIQSGEVLRALVGTQSGTGPATDWSSNVVVAAGSDLRVTCSYPTAVRSDYPDVVAGESVDTVTLAQSVTVYVQNVTTNQIRAFQESFIQGSSQVLEVTDWSIGSDIGTSLPVVASDFGLFKGASAPSVTSVVGASGFPAATYRVAFAFAYPTGESVTKISHKEADGCIRELTGSIAGEEEFDSLLLTYQSGQPVTGASQAGLFVDNTGTLSLREQSNGQAYQITGANTTVSVDFTQPASGSNVTITVRNSRWIAIGQIVYIEGGGYYTVVSKPSTSQIQIQNPVGFTNTASGATIPIGSLITSAGSAGPQGIQGVHGFGYRFIFSTSTSPGPSSGTMRLNSATLSSVTQIYVSESDRNGASVENALGSFAPSSLIQVMDETEQNVYAYFSLNSATDNGTSWTLGVTYQGSSGTTFSGSVSLAIALRGVQGAAATVAVGTVTTGAAGSSASVTNAGSSSAAVLNFTIPQGSVGATGAAATVAVGTVTTGAAGSSASVTNAGSSSAAVLNFTIPQGSVGATGEIGGVGLKVAYSTTTTAPPSSGEIRMNNSPATASQIFIHDNDRNGSNQSGTLALLVANSTLQVIDESDPSAYYRYTVDSATDNTTYYTFGVTPLGGTGTLSGNTFVSFSLAGPQGATGSVSAASGVKLTHTSAASTGAGESFLFVDSADQVLKIRAESDGSITTVGSGAAGGGASLEDIWLYGGL